MVVPTVEYAETANKVEAKETTVAEEAVVNRKDLKLNQMLLELQLILELM